MEVWVLFSVFYFQPSQRTVPQLLLICPRYFNTNEEKEEINKRHKKVL